MNILPGDTYRTWINREYTNLQSLVRTILAQLGIEVEPNYRCTTQHAADIIDRRSLLDKFSIAKGTSCWSYLHTCLTLPILQYIQQESRLWVSVVAPRTEVGSYDEKDDTSCPVYPQALITYQEDYLAYNEFLDRLEDDTTAVVVDRVHGYTDIEIETRYGFAHTKTVSCIKKAQSAYCAYTGMQIEPGPKERLILPDAYKGQYTTKNTRRLKGR